MPTNLFVTPNDPAKTLQVFDGYIQNRLVKIIAHRMPDGGLNLDITIDGKGQTLDILQFVDGQRVQVAQVLSDHPLTLYSHPVLSVSTTVDDPTAQEGGDANSSSEID